MGGKALKEIKTRRYNKEEFFEVWNSLKHLFDRLHCKYDLIKCYTNKESHGDMDIIVEYSNKDDLESKLFTITNFIQPDEIFRNSNMISMNFNELQVDILFILSENYDVCWHFFAYNDLGGFMGKIARSMKCKYGQEGLIFEIHSEDKSRLLSKVYLSRDPKKIIEFLGFDYYKFVRGFDTKEEIFKYITEGEFFRRATFDGSELNSSQKSRDMSRPMYIDLLQWVESHPGHKDKIDDRPTLDFVYKRIMHHFGMDLALITTLKRKDDDLIQSANKKFNGRHVMEYYNIKGSPLIGSLMNGFKNHFSPLLGRDIDYSNYIMKTSIDEIWKKFKEINKKLIEENNLWQQN